MRNVIVGDLAKAVEGLRDGSAVMMGGFGGAGLPRGLVEAVLELGVRDLTVISNNAGADGDDLSLWFRAGIVRKMICSYPRAAKEFAARYEEGSVELELVPQGTLIERIRCAGSGLGGFFTPVAVGTQLAEGKEVRIMDDGRSYLLEKPLGADFALLRGHRADALGNVSYRKTARNYSPIMAMAAKTVVFEVDEVVSVGAIDPECVVTPCIFVDRVVQRRGRA